MSIVNFNSSSRAHTGGTPLQINSSLDPKWVLCCKELLTPRSTRRGALLAKNF